MDKRKASEADLLKDNTIIGQNRKKILEESNFSGKSMLKRNEMSLVLLAAGVLTLIVFFLFFRPSGDLERKGTRGESQLAATVLSLDQRLTRIEEALQTFDTARMTLNAEGQGEPSDMAAYTARVERVETALSVKFDILTARVDNMEQKLPGMSKDIARNARAIGEKAMTSALYSSKNRGDSENRENTSGTKVSVKKKYVPSEQPESSKKSAATPLKTAAVTKQKVVNVRKVDVSTKSTREQVKNISVYHTIVKGDTLYNLSKRYDTTVLRLRKINSMTSKDAIVIGQKIMVKQ